MAPLSRLEAIFLDVTSDVLNNSKIKKAKSSVGH